MVTSRRRRTGRRPAGSSRSVRVQAPRASVFPARRPNGRPAWRRVCRRHRTTQVDVRRNAGRTHRRTACSVDGRRLGLLLCAACRSRYDRRTALSLLYSARIGTSIAKFPACLCECYSSHSTTPTPTSLPTSSRDCRRVVQLITAYHFNCASSQTCRRGSS